MRKSKTRKTSVIWDYFTRIDMTLAKCNICENKFSYRTSISNLKKHIQIKHPNFKSFVKTSKNVSKIEGDTDPEAEPEDDIADTKLSSQATSERVPSPVSSDACSLEASNAAPSFAVEIQKSSTPATSQSSKKPKQPTFKKIKLTHEVPFTESYLEETVDRFELRTSNMRKSPPPRPNPRIYQDEGNHICSSCPCIAAQENEYDKIGKAWASELKLMSMEQQIFAKRAIAEILFEGQMGGLSRHSVLICQEKRTADGGGGPFVIDNNECN